MGVKLLASLDFPSLDCALSHKKKKTLEEESVARHFLSLWSEQKAAAAAAAATEAVLNDDGAVEYSNLRKEKITIIAALY